MSFQIVEGLVPSGEDLCKSNWVFLEKKQLYMMNSACVCHLKCLSCGFLRQDRLRTESIRVILMRCAQEDSPCPRCLQELCALLLPVHIDVCNIPPDHLPDEGLRCLWRPKAFISGTKRLSCRCLEDRKLLLKFVILEIEPKLEAWRGSQGHWHGPHIL